MGVAERRKSGRVVFERGLKSHKMAIDGTRRRPCSVEDVSDVGAKITIEGEFQGLNLKEFFLLLSTTGLAYRRCELSWINGDQIGVTFIRNDKKKREPARGRAQHASA